MDRLNRIISDGETAVLARLTGPMIIGVLGMMIFNLVDTWFVGRLGTTELAALSFTFPVVMVIGSVAHGLGVGMTAAVSRAVGSGDRERQIQVISWGMGLAFLTVLAFVIAGLLTIDPVFTLLGADGPTLKVIREYMTVYYIGIPFVIIPMTGNSAIRGLGDTKTPSRVMLTAAVINGLLDPVLIFGWGPFPALGVVGAALATVASRTVTFFVAWYILIFRERVISLRGFSFSRLWTAWREILSVGLPNVVTKLIVPLGAGVFTGLIASGGPEAVAGYGIATRLDMFAMVIVQALVSVIPIFVGQNWGAGRPDRVGRGLRAANRFVLVYGAGMFLIMALAGGSAASLFNPDPGVVAAAAVYLRIVPLAYGCQGLFLIGVTALNVLNRPVVAGAITVIQMFGLAVPLGGAAHRLWGLPGLFAGIALSYVVAGLLVRRMALGAAGSAIPDAAGDRSLS